MSLSSNSFRDPKAKQSAIENIHDFLSQIPLSDRKRVMAFAGFKSITPEGFLKEVEEETELGLQIIGVHSAILKLNVELFELHLQELFLPLTEALRKAESLITGISDSAKNRDKALGENTKNLLLIHPDIPNDNYTSDFASPATQLVLNKAMQEGWNVNDLSGPQATLANVKSFLKNNNIDFVIHYDHGDPLALLGWDKLPAVDGTVVDGPDGKLLNKKAVSSVSCFPALPILGIGQQAVNFGAKAFLGYDSLHFYENSFHDSFVNSANAANFALLDGKTFLEARTIGLQTYQAELQTISRSNSEYTYAGYILLASNSWHFQMLGR